MKILFTRFPFASANGGAENQTIWLMRGLQEKGHEVSFVGDCPVLLRRTKESGIRNQELGIGKPPVTKWLAFSFLWRGSKMHRSLKAVLEQKPDVIVMLSMSEKLLLTDDAAKQGIKVIWIEHDRVGRWLTKSPWLTTLKRMSKHATIVCVSELSKMKYLELGFLNVVAIPNGVPRPPHPPAPSPGYGRRGELHLGCVARLSREKGVDVLMRAIADMPEVTLTIVGRGPEEGYTRALIEEDSKRIGVQRIFLKPNVEHLNQFYASIDALVLPSSDHDPFGLVAAEAMMRSVPVIVTDACGIAAYLHDGGDALVAHAGSHESLTKCIKTITDPHTRSMLASAGEKKARQQFSLDAMVHAYAELLEKP